MNLIGDDFVVFEQGTSPESYAVAVRPSGALDFTVSRYEFPDRQFEPVSPDNDTFIATAFDLSDFGLSQGVLIDEVRLIAVGVGDSVDDPSGEGNVLLNDTSGFPLRFGGPLGDGGIVTDGRDDADIMYVVPLGALELCSLTVSSFGDTGPGSLREAIICANATPGPDTITLSPGTYTLSMGGGQLSMR